MPHDNVLDAIAHYQRKIVRHLEDADVLQHAIRKLAKVDGISIAILQETGIGRLVNSLKKHDDLNVSEMAKELVKRWKEVVAEEEAAENEQDEPDSEQASIEPSDDEGGPPRNGEENSDTENVVHDPENGLYNVYDSSNEVDESKDEDDKNTHLSDDDDDDDDDEDLIDVPLIREEDEHTMQIPADFVQIQTEEMEPNSHYLKPEETLPNVDDKASRHTHERKDDDIEKSHRHHQKKKLKRSREDKEPERKSSHHKKKKRDHHDRKSESSLSVSSNHRKSESSSAVSSHHHDKKTEPSSSSHHHRHHKSSSSSKDKQRVEKSDKHKDKSSPSTGKTSSSSSSRKSKSHKNLVQPSSAFDKALGGFETAINDGQAASKSKKKSSSSSKHVKAPSSSLLNGKNDLHKSKSRSSSSSSSKQQNSSSTSSKTDSRSKTITTGNTPSSAAKSESVRASLPTDTINPDYKPMSVHEPIHQLKKSHPEASTEESLSALIAMSKGKASKRTAVYSGTKRTGYFGEVPSLHQLCVHVLQEHVDSIEECGNLSFDVLAPILERASPQTLMRIEEFNPYLMEQTGSLWKKFCGKQFPKEKREEFESYREMFERCTQEREEKLDRLKMKVKDSYQREKTGAKKAKLAYVGLNAKPPRNVVRAQARYGTGHTTATSLVTTKKTVQSELPAPAPLAQTPSAASTATAPNPSSSSSSSSSHPKKPRIAPMMAKTLKMARGMKVGFRR